MLVERRPAVCNLDLLYFKWGFTINEHLTSVLHMLFKTPPQNTSVHTQTHLCTHRLFIVLSLCESNTVTLYYIRCGSIVSYLLLSKLLFSLSSKMTIDLDFLDVVCPTADSCPLPFELTFEVRLMRVNHIFSKRFFSCFQFSALIWKHLCSSVAADVNVYVSGTGKQGKASVTQNWTDLGILKRPSYIPCPTRAGWGFVMSKCCSVCVEPASVRAGVCRWWSTKYLQNVLHLMCQPIILLKSYIFPPTVFILSTRYN